MDVMKTYPESSAPLIDYTALTWDDAYFAAAAERLSGDPSFGPTVQIGEIRRNMTRRVGGIRYR